MTVTRNDEVINDDAENKNLPDAHRAPAQARVQRSRARVRQVPAGVERRRADTRRGVGDGGRIESDAGDDGGRVQRGDVGIGAVGGAGASARVEALAGVLGGGRRRGARRAERARARGEARAARRVAAERVASL